MAIANAFERFYNFLANLGLVLRDDPPKLIDMAGREWGSVVDGLSLSIREIPRDDPRELAVLSVVIRNDTSERRTLTIPGWLFFYEVQVEGAALTAYGSQLLKAERKTERIEVSLGSGEARETDLPLGALYAMKSGQPYRVVVLCRPGAGVVVRSNEIVVHP